MVVDLTVPEGVVKEGMGDRERAIDLLEVIVPLVRASEVGGGFNSLLVLDADATEGGRA